MFRRSVATIIALCLVAGFVPCSALASDPSSQKAGSTLVAVGEMPAQEGVYYVATDGDDANPGTLEKPFKTIAHAANVMKAGDTCYIRGGTYRETLADFDRNSEPTADVPSVKYDRTIKPLMGSADAPITFKAYNGEKVSLTGTEPVTGWSEVDKEKHIWRASMGWDMYLGTSLGSGTPLPEGQAKGIANGNVVFVNEKPCVEARWPNADQTTSLGITDSIMDLASYAVTDEGSGKNAQGEMQVVDAALADFPGNADLSGAQLWCAGGEAYGSLMYLINRHDKASNTLVLDELKSAGGSPDSWTTITTDNIYYVTRSYACLDQPGEWYKDVESGQLYLCAEAGKNPNKDYVVEAKKRRYAIDLNESSYVTFKGIDIYGGIVNFSGRANHCTLTDAEIQATDTCQGPTSYSAGWANTNGYGRALGVLLGGTANAVTRCDFHDMYGEAVRVQGSGNFVVNNRIRRANIEHSSASPAIYMDARVTWEPSTGHLISHNTISHVARGTIGGRFKGCEISYNDLSYAMRLSRDGGVIYLNFNDYGNSELHHNVFHDSRGNDGYYQCGLYLDPLTQGLVVHHNLFYNIENDQFSNTPLWSKGCYEGEQRQTLTLGPYDLHLVIANNTFINTSPLRIPHWSKQPTPDYGGGLMANNLFRSGYVMDGACSLSDLGWTEVGNLAGTSKYRENHPWDGTTSLRSSGGWDMTYRTDFSNPDEGDYTLADDSDAINAGVVIPGITDDVTDGKPDVGAYEKGQDAWKAGCDWTSDFPLTLKLNGDIPMRNLLVDGGFEQYEKRPGDQYASTDDFTLKHWQREGGITSYYSRAWNWWAEFTGDGDYAMQMGNGAKLTQTVSGLKPDTVYAVSGYGRVASEYVSGNSAAAGWDKDGKKVAKVAPESSIGSARTLLYRGVDFGASGANQVNMGFSGTGLGTSGQDLVIKVRLDSRTSPVAGELYFDQYRAYANKHEWLTVDLNEVAFGAHDVYIEFDTSFMEGKENAAGDARRNPDKIGKGKFYGFNLSNTEATDAVTIAAQSSEDSAKLVCRSGRFTRPQQHCYVRTGADGTVQVSVEKTGGKGSALFGFADTLGLYEVFPALGEVSLPDGKLLERVASQLDEQGIGYLRDDRALLMAQTDIAQVRALDLSNAGITSLEGLRTFTALEQVDVSGNAIADASAVEGLKIPIEKPTARKGLVYTGAKQSGLTVTDGLELTGVSSASKVGDYVVIATPKEGYAWKGATGTYADAPVLVEWSIAKKQISVPKGKTGLVYTGKSQVGVAKGTGYTVVKGGSATEAGKHTATLQADASHQFPGAKDTASVQWTIASKSIAGAKVALKSSSGTYNGKKQAGTVKSVTLGTVKLKAKTDYSVSVKSGANVGSYKVTVTGAGNYKGTVTATYKVKAAKPTLKATTAKKVKAAAAKKAAQKLKMSVKSPSKGKLTYKVVKRNKHITFKNGVATLKRGAYKPGKKQTMKVMVTQAAKGNYAKASKTLTLTFNVK